MQVVSFSLLFLLVGCSTVKWPVEPPPIPQSKPMFQSAVQATIIPIKFKYLVWSNANPYTVNFTVESKTNIVWNIYAAGVNNALAETNVQIYPSNKLEVFRVGFSR